GSLHHVRASVARPTGRGERVDRVGMTVRSATLVRTALAGAVVGLIAVGLTAPALAGSDDDCADPGAHEALLSDRSCPEERRERALGDLLNPQFPDFPDFPGLDDEDDGEDEDEEDEDEEDEDEEDEDEEDEDEEDEDEEEEPDSDESR